LSPGLGLDLPRGEPRKKKNSEDTSDGYYCTPLSTFEDAKIDRYRRAYGKERSSHHGLNRITTVDLVELSRQP
jgi:hypothetical protein